MMIGDETVAGAMNGSIDLTASGGVPCIVSSHSQAIMRLYRRMVRVVATLIS